MRWKTNGFRYQKTSYFLCLIQAKENLKTAINS